MYNLELIISGNLTGFSRFYASPGANNLFKDTKIDLDCRNFVTFVEKKDKAYAISFAPQVITLSLITRILDSFHRPGILVVSLLLPRNTKVESVNNPQDEKAVYQLLNAINNKFYEKNFKDGMLNQNPIVLMQDYYSEILANYRLVQDNQRGVNVSIDNSVFNKNVGYVKSAEKDIVSYLNTPCRRNYEGYQSIFISPKAPQNINEPVEELKLYNVYVNNTKQRLSNVTIDSVIQTVYPKRGECDNIPEKVKNLTYRQVLDGQGGRYIDANINDDTIYLVYHFEKETKQVTFQIIGDCGEMDFAQVSLVVQNEDGTYCKIANNPYIFEGEEIYGRKTIRSGNDKYNFSQPLDLSRIPSGGTVSVKISPTISQPSNNRTVNSISTPLVSPKDGKENTRATNVHRNLKNETPIKNGGTLSIFKSNNNKGKTKSNHDIRNVVLPLVALWIVLGGIYATWTYFGKNSEPTNQETAAVDSVNKKISFYIADISSSQYGEVVSDSLKRNVYDKFYEKYHITFELSALINRSSAKVELIKNDIVHYDVNVGGVPDDSLNVNLIVKWTGEGRQESILKIPKAYSLSELKEGEEKIAIQLPVAFSDLMFYNDLKNSTYKEQRTSDRIERIKAKSEMLYDKMMEEYQKKKEKSIAVENKPDQVAVNEKPKLKKKDIFALIKKGNAVNGNFDLKDEEKYNKAKQEELINNWNAVILGQNKEEKKDLKEKSNNMSKATWAWLEAILPKNKNNENN